VAVRKSKDVIVRVRLTGTGSTKSARVDA